MRKERKSLTRFYFIIPLWFVVLVISIYPFLSAIWTSLTDQRLTMLAEAKWVGLENYRALCRDDQFIRAIINTIIFVLTAVSVEFVLGLALALLLHRHFLRRIRGVMRSLLLTPMFITPVAVGLMFRYMLNVEYGIIPHALRMLGLPLVDFFTPSRALFSIVLIDVWQWTPFMLLLLSAGLESLPQDCYDAAKVDGAGALATFVYVTLPLLRPVILVTILVRMLDAFRVFEYIYTITRGGPGGATETLMYHVYQIGFRFFRMGEASAKAVVFAFMISVIVLLVFYILKRVEEQV